MSKEKTKKEDLNEEKKEQDEINDTFDEQKSDEEINETKEENESNVNVDQEDENLNEQEDKQEDSNISNKEYNDLKEKYDKVENSYQRLLADYDNMKRRNAQEVMEAQNKGKIEVFKSMLEIIDNFERSMNYEAQTDEFKEGIQMVHKMFNQRLKDVGLTEVEADGILDPTKHQAVMVEESSEHEDGQILDVLQKGYCVEENIIRPAMVKVNKKDNKE